MREEGAIITRVFLSPSLRSGDKLIISNSVIILRVTMVEKIVLS